MACVTILLNALSKIFGAVKVYAIHFYSENGDVCMLVKCTMQSL